MSPNYYVLCYRLFMIIGNKMKSLRFFASLLAFLPFCYSNAYAQLVVNINEGQKKQLQIAIADFSGPKGADIARVVREDLDRSGLFAVQDPTSFVAKNYNVNLTPKFADWRATNTEALVVGGGTNSQHKLRVEFRLWDIYGENQNLGLEFSSTPENWRRIAHKIADAIYKRTTGKSGMFDSRVVYVSESGPSTNRVKRLALMDQDGANPSYLTDGKEQILNPRFNATGQQIVYSALTEDGIRLWVFDIETGRREAVTGTGELVFAPRFSPDGQSLVYSVAKDGNIDIFSKNLKTGEQTKLTNDPSIDTSPAFSADQKQIVFTSDRSGSPQIYKMNIDGTNSTRLSFGAGRYSTPVWANEGNLIAFTKQINGQFQIGVMDSNGGEEKILTSAYLVEGPSFSPNSRAIIFQKEDGPGAPSSLWTIDINGSNLRKLSSSSNGSDPTWSPMLE
jgi:TolB protein